MTAPLLLAPASVAGIVVDELPADCACCRLPLAGHPGPVLHVDGQIVGSALCARLLYCRIRRLCTDCGVPLDQVCGHTAAALAEIARAPQYWFPARRPQEVAP